MNRTKLLGTLRGLFIRDLGRFEGQLDLRIPPPPCKRKWWQWLFPLRPEAIILSTFTYIDKNGVRWEALPGTRINGLSSPWCLWRLMPPFEWRGIRASAIHDANCLYRNHPSWKVHQAMYRAMRCDNMSLLRAWTAWFLVRTFGPRFPGTLNEK